jgi:hypothetical protein
MRVLQKILLTLLVVFILVQFIPRNVNKYDQTLSTDFLKVYPVPGEVKAVLQEACYDCHSNNTRYPWYAAIQPFRLWLDNHIKKGKEELNFSEYGSYSAKRQYNKLNSIEESIKKETMPIKFYKIMHPEAKLRSSQKESLMSWLVNTRDALKASSKR